MGVTLPDILVFPQIKASVGLHVLLTTVFGDLRLLFGLLCDFGIILLIFNSVERLLQQRAPL